MSEINDLNEVKYEYCVPMGKPGAIVIKAPVVLSTLKVSIPISEIINIDSNVSRIEIISNRISMKKPEINRDNVLIINGDIYKDIRYFEDDSDNDVGRDLEMKISINSEVLINFDQIPIYNPDSNKNIFYKKSEVIRCNFEYIKFSSDRISQSKDSYYNDLLLELVITLTQIQNVFIPEPDGDFILNNNNLKHDQFKDNSTETNNSKYLVGYDNSRGLIANIIEPNKII